MRPLGNVPLASQLSSDHAWDRAGGIVAALMLLSLSLLPLPLPASQNQCEVLTYQLFPTSPITAQLALFSEVGHGPCILWERRHRMEKGAVKSQCLCACS